MRLVKARVQNYRSIIDTGEFEIEDLKTIMVGPNEAGKTALLKALQQLNQPKEVAGFEVLRDYPRAKYYEITTKMVKPEEVVVVSGWFKLEDKDKALIPAEFHECLYKVSKKIDNQVTHELINAPARLSVKDIKNDLARMVAHIDKQYVAERPDDEANRPGNKLKQIQEAWPEYAKADFDLYYITHAWAKQMKDWLDTHYSYVEEGNEKEEERHAKLLNQIAYNNKREDALKILYSQVPVFILFNNYFKVKPNIHLEHLAQRIERDILDDDAYDYGNICLLKLLGFTARQLADLGKATSPDMKNTDAMKKYRDTLDTRSYQLNAASVQLTTEIRSVWMPNHERQEADKLNVRADGQYLKVVVEDDQGVEVELDQRSEGFQWLVSFFVVFFAEAMDKHKNAILLLDEPGVSLHGLKQRDFRATISRLAEKNQTIYTTHSPFLVGPNELDLVRVVEMKSRKEGTKVHTTISSSDPAGLLPLQEAFGYDLAQSLFTQQRNLILEGITDYWYIDATAALLRAAGTANLNEKIALVFSNTAGKVVYYATILHAHSLKVAALLDSDSAGDQAAKQDNLVVALGNKSILRTKDYCTGVPKAEIEDLLRDTLVDVVKNEFKVDTSALAASQPSRPIVDIFGQMVPSFSKYNLAKAYIRWTRNHDANDFTTQERMQWIKLIETVNKVLK